MTRRPATVPDVARGTAREQGLRVMVTDARRGSALAIIRALGRRGDHVVAAADSSLSAGLRSKFASGQLVHPPALDEPDAAAEAIVDAARRRRIDVLVPVTDEVILPLLARRDRLPAGCAIAVPADDALDIARDKVATIDLAGRLGVPVPEGREVATSDEARQVAARLGYPVVVKPRRSRIVAADGSIRRLTVSYAAESAELTRRIEDLAGCTAIVQAYEPGEGHGVEMLLDRGRLVAAFQHRRIREVPVTGGASSYRESVPLDPDLAVASERMLGELGWHGLAMVEYRVGPAGPRLMEINGRIWGSLPLAVAAGVDFPGLTVDLFAGRPVAPRPATYRTGLRMRNLELDLVWIGGVIAGRSPRGIVRPPRRAALRALRDLADPRVADDILSATDPMPGIVELVRLAGKLAGKATGGRAS